MHRNVVTNSKYNNTRFASSNNNSAAHQQMYYETLCKDMDNEKGNKTNATPNA